MSEGVGGEPSRKIFISYAAQSELLARLKQYLRGDAGVFMPIEEGLWPVSGDAPELVTPTRNDPAISEDRIRSTCEFATTANCAPTHEGKESGAVISPSHDLTVRVAHNLRRLRKLRRWTQEDVARRMGRPMRTNEVSRWENAHVRPSEQKLFKLAALYDVDIGELFAEFVDDDEENAA